MKKNIIITAAIAAMLSSCDVYAGNSFTDVPKEHWAYDAIEELAQKGVLMGYTDGSFRGENTMSRNTMAMLTAKMLANIEQFIKEERELEITKDDIKLLEDLSYEFQDELSTLGTSAKNISEELNKIKEDTKALKDDISKISNKVDNKDKVVVSGEMLVDFINRHKRVNNNGIRNYTDAEFDLIFDAKIDDNISAHAYWTVYYDQYGNQLGGGSNVNNNIFEAYIDIDDLANGRLRIGRNYYSHGNALVIHEYLDTLQYKTKYNNLDVSFNIFYTRQPFSRFGLVDDNNHQIWNISIDSIGNKNDWYFGYYAQTYKDNVTNGAPVADDFKDAERNIVEIGATGVISEKAKLDYEVDFVLSQTKGKVYSATDGWKSLKDEGLLQHYAVNYSDTNDKLKFKIDYTSANAEYNGTIALRHTDDKYDCEPIAFDDVARILSDYSDNFANTKDLKFQLEYNSIEDKHSFRFAYDLLDEKNDVITTDFMGTSNTCNLAGYDKLNTNIMTLEYRYRITEHTRLKVGYTTADNSSSVKNGEKVKDETLFWTEIYSKF